MRSLYIDRVLMMDGAVVVKQEFLSCFNVYHIKE